MKNGKAHHYWSVVESRRLARNKVVQRQVLYLGEISGQQKAAWEKTISVFDEPTNSVSQPSLFPGDSESGQPICAAQANAISLVVTEMSLHRPRAFGDCWLGCLLWEELGLRQFWQEKLGAERGEVPWENVLRLLAVNRLCEPGSEFAVHRNWFANSAMDELLGVDFSVAAKDRLYRCLDKILPHKNELCKMLVERWKTLFDASFDVLLYDLTSTYFEGQCAANPLAKHGYSRDNRSDCRQVVIALVVTPDGLPMAYEVLAGNTADKTTLKSFLAKIQALYGKARRVWVMDRGVPTEATLQQMREDQIAYLVGTPKVTLGKLQCELIDQKWEQVHQGMKVKLLEKQDELYVQAASDDRQKKENAMRHRKFKIYARGLHRLKKQLRKKRKISRDRLLEKLAVLKKEAGKIAGFFEIRKPTVDEKIDNTTFTYTFKSDEYKTAKENDGNYILRAHLPTETDSTANSPEQPWPKGLEKQAKTLWKWYMQLVHVEEAFKTLKSDLGLRPVHHQLQQRVEAHVLIAFLGYCLNITLRMKLNTAAPGLSCREVLQSLGKIQMLEVHIPTTDGRTLILPRHTEPEEQQQMMLSALNLQLPTQPPPKIRAGVVSAKPLEAMNMPAE